MEKTKSTQTSGNITPEVRQIQAHQRTILTGLRGLANEDFDLALKPVLDFAEEIWKNQRDDFVYLKECIEELPKLLQAKLSE